MAILSNKFDIEAEYLNKKVNDINLSQPRKREFNKYVTEGDITRIFIKTKDKNAEGKILEMLIDTDNLPLLKSYNSHIQVMWNNTKMFYARFYIYDGYGENGKVKYKTTYIHRLLTNAKENDYVDHINFNSLDNRLANLRVTANDLNLRNRSGKNKNNKSGHRNVSWRYNHWVVQLQLDGKNTILGEFPKDKLKEAADFAKKMRQKYYGKFKGVG
jgi:hypothetical protein